MFRTLLALSLALTATSSLAAETTQADNEAPSCIKAEPAAAGKPATTGDSSSTGSRPGNPAPVRPRASSTRSTPRWSSLLPGMFR